MFARFMRSAALYALALLLPISAIAATPPSNADQHAVLFRVEKAGVPPSWLFGTVHVADPRVTHLSQPISDAYTSSDHIYTEVRLDFGVMMEMAKTVLRPEGDLLSDHIDKAHYEKLLPALAARQYPEVATRRLYTWAAAMLMVAPVKETGQLPLDLMLAKMSVEGGKDYQGLETIAEQLSLFQAIPEDKQRALLYSLLDHPEEAAAQLKQLIDAYVKRDLPDVLKLEEEPDTTMSAADAKWFEHWLKYPMLLERNHRFIDRLKDPLTTGNAFIAIGALHLPGNEGVVNLLRQAGYTVTPVIDTPAQ